MYISHGPIPVMEINSWSTTMVWSHPSRRKPLVQMRECITLGIPLPHSWMGHSMLVHHYSVNSMQSMHHSASLLTLGSTGSWLTTYEFLSTIQDRCGTLRCQTDPTIVMTLSKLQWRLWHQSSVFFHVRELSPEGICSWGAFVLRGYCFEGIMSVYHRI